MPSLCVILTVVGSLRQQQRELKNEVARLHMDLAPAQQQCSALQLQLSQVTAKYELMAAENALLQEQKLQCVVVVAGAAAF